MSNPVLTLLVAAHAVCVAVASHAAPKLEMPMLGQSLPPVEYVLVNSIPAPRLARLPRTLPVFRYSGKPAVFPLDSLQKLLDESLFAGTNIHDLLRYHGNQIHLGEPVRLGTSDSLDSFLADPFRADITLQSHGIGVDLRHQTPPRDGVPSFEAIRDRLFRYARAFGVSTNDMEWGQDGSVHLRKTDSKRVMRGGAIEFVNDRSVAISRGAAGYALLANDDKVELDLAINGWLRRFVLRWPPMETVRTNSLLTAARLLDEIKKGNVLADVTNEYPSDGISQIILKDIRLAYYGFSKRGFGPISTNTDILPVASLHAVFKSKSGKTTDGGLYAPITDQK